MSAYKSMLHVCRKNAPELCHMKNVLQRSSQILNYRLFTTCKILCDKKDGPGQNDKDKFKILEDIRKTKLKQKAAARAQLDKISQERAAMMKKKAMNQNLKDATKAIGNVVPEIERELMNRIRMHQERMNSMPKHVAEIRQTQSPEFADSFTNILKNMKQIETKTPTEGEKQQVSQKTVLWSNYARSHKGGYKYRPDFGANDKLVVLFQGEGLGIFSKDDAIKPPKSVSEEAEKTHEWESLWDIEKRESLKEMEPYPTNRYEEMIRLTNEGKMWQFPINNDHGWTEEENVEFHEHVFLDECLEDFPKTGPVRHFMELVVTGLTHNPYISIQEKYDHIDWFRQYFIEKQDLLQEGLGEEGVMRIK